MPLIIVKQTHDASESRSAEIINNLTKAYSETTGIDSKKVTVILEVVGRDRWGSGGKTLRQLDESREKENEHEK